MANKIKSPGETTTQVSVVANHVVIRKLTESSAFVLIGIKLSTGAPFQRAFPSTAALNQWITSGDGADVEITRLEPTAVFTA